MSSMPTLKALSNPKLKKTGDKSELTSEHEACGFGYQVVRCDGKASKPVILEVKMLLKYFSTT